MPVPCGLTTHPVDATSLQAGRGCLVVGLVALPWRSLTPGGVVERHISGSLKCRLIMAAIGSVHQTQAPDGFGGPFKTAAGRWL